MNLSSAEGRRLLFTFALVFVCQHSQATYNKSLSTNISYSQLKEPSTDPLPYIWSRECELLNFDVKERKRYATLAIKSEFKIFRKKLSVNLDQKIIYDTLDVAALYNCNVGEKLIRDIIFETKLQSAIRKTYLTVLNIDTIGWDFAIAECSRQEPFKVTPFVALKRGVKLRLMELAEECNCKNSAIYLRYLSEHIEYEITGDTKIYKKTKEPKMGGYT